MRYVIVVIVLLHFAAGVALGGDYIRLGVDSIESWTYSAEIPFYAERTCPDPAMLMATSNGFVLNATGSVVWEFVDYQEESYLQSWFLLSFLFTNGFDDVNPDTFLTGGASMPPSGMPVFDDRLWFTIWLNVGGVGAICIDSAFVFSAGAWKWSGMQCGLGGAPDRPLFVDKYGNDDEHPICITVYADSLHPEPDDHIRIGVDSLAAGTVRAELPFYVSRTCPLPEVVEYISNGFIITATGGASWSFADYLVGPQIQEWFSLAGSLLNMMDNTDPDSFMVWSSAVSPRGLPFTTEELYFTLYLDIGSGLGEICIDSGTVFPVNSWIFVDLVCGEGGDNERPLFLAKDSSDMVHPICITIFESLCGDTDLDGAIDIDDIVYLLQYVFSSEPISIVPDKADVDCSGAVDIDDVVYLLYYVFGAGPGPCAGCP